ncbi:MAG: NAD(P)H-hydrate dehydratase [Bdellovibrionales bacterium]|nr:NAD(P)H-hydrate dehydratase [Ramlibacter sp.]
MQRILAGQPHDLFDIATTRLIEQAAAAKLPAHSLMERAGLQVARLAMALAPHAHTIWVACGPGNNGGDGLQAAAHLRRWGKNPVVTWLGHEAAAPADTLASLQLARDHGVTFSDSPPPDYELCIDSLLGIGASRSPAGKLAEWIALMNTQSARVLAVDVPSGLNAETGVGVLYAKARDTLCLLNLKPGLFTAGGRDAAGDVWFDDLGVQRGNGAAEAALTAPCARLPAAPSQPTRLHTSHKGTYGDVAIVAGAPGMTGAALLAASAALHSGCGRVLVCLLDDGSMRVDASQPELMFRDVTTMDFKRMTVVCGCGGGDAVREVLARVCSTAQRLVLDADALNAVAANPQFETLIKTRAARGLATVMTPHPLEAARLLATTAAQVQANRLDAARQLAARFACTVALKGSGTVIASPDEISLINPTGNALLATAGTGDVLAGMVGARLAAGLQAFLAASEAVYWHGYLADQWPASTVLTASLLAKAPGLSSRT